MADLKIVGMDALSEYASESEKRMDSADADWVSQSDAYAESSFSAPKASVAEASIADFSESIDAPDGCSFILIEVSDDLREASSGTAFHYSLIARLRKEAGGESEPIEVARFGRTAGTKSERKAILVIGSPGNEVMAYGVASTPNTMFFMLDEPLSSSPMPDGCVPEFSSVTVQSRYDSNDAPFPLPSPASMKAVMESNINYYGG